MGRERLTWFKDPNPQGGVMIPQGEIFCKDIVAVKEPLGAHQRGFYILLTTTFGRTFVLECDNLKSKEIWNKAISDHIHYSVRDHLDGKREQDRLLATQQKEKSKIQAKEMARKKSMQKKVGRIEKRGWMEKKGEKNKAYKKRWFVLDVSACIC